MCNCNTTLTIPCTCTTACTGCKVTVNTDCVLFTGEKLSYENDAVLSNSTRTLSSVLEAVENQTSTTITSKFVHIGDGNYTLLASDHDKLIVLYDYEGLVGETANIILPSNSLEFAGKTFTFLNKVPAANGTWSFNIPLVTDYDPLTTNTAYNTIVSDSVAILKIAFVQTTPTAYGWVIVQR